MNFLEYYNMMKGIAILFLKFFTMYFEVQIMVIWNNHEYGVLMNGSVKCVENWGKNNECMHVKCKYVVTTVWNNSIGIKFQFYQFYFEMSLLQIYVWTRQLITYLFYFTYTVIFCTFTLEPSWFFVFCTFSLKPILCKNSFKLDLSSSTHCIFIGTFEFCLIPIF
jgi:hypothetical protein